MFFTLARTREGEAMPATNPESVRSYIADLPVGAPRSLGAEGASAVNAIDIDDLPAGVVTGSNLLQFPPDASPALRSSVALSLLAAQRVATNDPAVTSPTAWLKRHDDVLQHLNWRREGGGVAESHFDSIDVAVHKAIIPFLAAALGGAVGAGVLILTAVKQLQDMDKNSPWITLFDRESRRFDVTEYQFSVVQVVDDAVHLKLAAARLDASYGRTQVLFFKLKNQHAAFEQANQSYVTEAGLLADLNGDLKAKMASMTKSFIRSLPDDLLLGAGT
jgi:hypothetical protein